jgi:beta-1,4-mannosyltransferase
MRVLAYPGFEVGELNPYTRLLYENIRKNVVDIVDFSARRALLGRYDIFHLHWPEYYVAQKSTFKAVVGSFGLLFLVSWARLRGAKVVWTVHNLESHRQTRPRAEKLYWKAFTRLVDGYFALTSGGYEAARERFPPLRSVPGFIVPHGHYRGAYPNSVSRAEARLRLGISDSAKAAVFFGNIARYKNVSALIRAFRKLDMPEAVLRVVGDCKGQLDPKTLEVEAASDPRIDIRLGFVPSEEVSYLFSASDLVVLPFAEILNSGSALLALSFNRPILVPAKGAMSELQQSVGAEWVQMYEGDLTSIHLAKALAWATNAERPKVAPLDDLGWEKLGAKTLEAYKALVDDDR